MGVKIRTIKDIRSYLSAELHDLYDEHEIRIIAEILIRSASGMTKMHQLYDGSIILSSVATEKIIAYATDLKSGKPVQYVTGETSFYNCRIKVNPSTLIPRPETEELVDLILRENKGFSGSVLDFGTGSGCISVALAANMPLASVTGIDISEEALSIARENAELNHVMVKFLQGDVFSFDWKRAGTADIIVSNPPYVRESEKMLMSKNVLDFEPPAALFVPDENPLVYYEAILSLAAGCLKKSGRIYFEINEKMSDQLTKLLKESGYSDVMAVKDINERYRIIKGIKND